MDIEKEKLAITCFNYIKHHYTEQITLDDVAKAAFISKWYVCNILKEVYEINFMTILHTYRIEEAKRLIKQKITFKELPGLLGYNDYSSFHRMFKKLTGRTPNQFKLLFKEG
jgi:two-component system response regulator YesN